MGRKQPVPDDTPIVELLNLGPACARDLEAVDIHNAGDIRELGVEKSFEVMMLGRIARGEKGFCFNASYLYALYGAIHDVDWREIPESKKKRFKNLTAKLRAEHG